MPRRPPSAPRIVPSETDEQRVLAQWLNVKRILWAHCPNGGLRSWSQGRMFKSIGVMPGVPDVLIFSPAPNMPGARGVAIELKRTSGAHVTPQQEAWLDALRRAGWVAEVCAGAAAAIKTLAQLGY